jgi:uncharacterized membrane protein HdeD (DUF308 family)
MSETREPLALVDEILVRNWGLVALRGVAALIFGIMTLLQPGIALWTLVVLFGAYALVDGALTVVSVLANRRSQPHWGAALLGGILGVLVGVAAFLWPGITALSLLFLIAGWAIVRGVAEIVTAVRLRRVIDHEWLLALAGVVSVAFGAMLLLFPVPGALAVVLWIGAWATVSGVLLLILGFRLRSWGRAHHVFDAPRAT